MMLLYKFLGGRGEGIGSKENYEREREHTSHHLTKMKVRLCRHRLHRVQRLRPDREQRQRGPLRAGPAAHGRSRRPGGSRCPGGRRVLQPAAELRVLRRLLLLLYVLRRRPGRRRRRRAEDAEGDGRALAAQDRHPQEPQPGCGGGAGDAIQAQVRKDKRTMRMNPFVLLQFGRCLQGPLIVCTLGCLV